MTQLKQLVSQPIKLSNKNTITHMPLKKHDFGRRTTYTLSRHGDLVNTIYLTIDLSKCTVDESEMVSKECYNKHFKDNK